MKMPDFQLRRIGQIMEPERGGPQRGVPAAMFSPGPPPPTRCHQKVGFHPIGKITNPLQIVSSPVLVRQGVSPDPNL